VTAALDEKIRWLEDFNELIRTTNPAVEAGASELGRLGDSLRESGSQLSLHLDHLAADLDGLQQETQAAEAAAVKSCQELGQAAVDAKAPLDDLDKDAAAARDHWTQALQEQASALDTAVKEAAAAGWEPLDQCLADAIGDFEKWTKGADSALGDLVQHLDEAHTGVAQERDRVTGAAHYVIGGEPFYPPLWQEPEAAARSVLDEAIPRLRNEQAAPISKESLALNEELVTGLEQSSAQVQARLDTIGKDAATEVGAQEAEVTTALESAGEALQRAQSEFERGAIQAEETETEAQALAELAGQVDKAQVQVRQIKAVMEAMGQ
jgi:hypothetical protein